MVDRTYSLDEAADIICGSHEQADMLWLERQLRKGGRLEGLAFKAGRKWRMTPSDVDGAIELLRPMPKQAVPVVPSPSGMTRTSRRRLGIE